MTHKSAGIAARVAMFDGSRLDARYLGYFDCFKRQQFYEAHEVLEDLWLAARQGPDGDFFKGLIQVAGAFVHLQKDRLRPADALFQLAERNLRKYPAHHWGTDVTGVLRLIDEWREALNMGGFATNPLRVRPPPLPPLPV